MTSRASALTGRGAVLALLAVAALGGLVSDAGAAQGLVLLALATAPALFAVPPRGRPLLGVALVLVAAAALSMSPMDADTAAWTSAVALIVAGLLVVWRGRHWTPMSRRYDRAAGSRAEASDPRDLWQALDRGEDPTDHDSPQPGEEPERPRPPSVD